MNRPRINLPASKFSTPTHKPKQSKRFDDLGVFWKDTPNWRSQEEPLTGGGVQRPFRELIMLDEAEPIRNRVPYQLGCFLWQLDPDMWERPNGWFLWDSIILRTNRKDPIAAMKLHLLRWEEFLGLWETGSKKRHPWTWLHYSEVGLDRRNKVR